MDIRCGTAGWTDKTLIACKRFYPRDCSSAEARLRFYASRLPRVEVESSSYAMPSASNELGQRNARSLIDILDAMNAGHAG